MEQRNIGTSGIGVSIVGLGCNNFGGAIDEERSRAVIHRALDKGITLFDTADVYAAGKSEEIIGRTLAGRRREAVILTKFGLPMAGYSAKVDGSPAYVKIAAENSLRRLGTDYIDILMMHRPDGVTPIEETLRALDDLVKEGKVRHAAASSLSGAAMAEAVTISKTSGLTSFVTGQDEYSLLARGVEREFPEFAALGVGFLPYFPLASGMLTGKYRKDAAVDPDSRLARMPGVIGLHMTDRDFAIVEKLRAFAHARGHGMVELAFSWLVANPIVSSVIAGATSPAQIDANAAAPGWKLTAAELAEIDAITRD